MCPVENTSYDVEWREFSRQADATFKQAFNEAISAGHLALGNRSTDWKRQLVGMSNKYQVTKYDRISTGSRRFCLLKRR